jgi:hypothetical protein
MHNLKGFLLSSIALLSAFFGCTTGGGVWLRPDGSPGPQECPAEAKQTIRWMNLHAGDSTSVLLDAKQGGSQRIILYDGPVESFVWGDLGPLSGGSRLYGRVWTGGPHVVIRYYEALPSNGEKIPFCAVAQLDGEKSRKLPESKPGFAIIGTSSAKAIVVDRFP